MTGERAALRERIARALWAVDPPFIGYDWDAAEDSDEDGAHVTLRHVDREEAQTAWTNRRPA